MSFQSRFINESAQMPSVVRRVGTASSHRLRGIYNFSRALPGSLELHAALRNVDLPLYFGGALGDDLLCTAIAHEASIRGVKSIAMMTQHPELFKNNPSLSQVIQVAPHEPSDIVLRTLSWLGRRVVVPHYTQRDWELDYDAIPQEHIIAAMCKKAGITGEINLRPYIYLSDEELAKGEVAKGYIVMQSSCRGALLPMENKEWSHERWRLVASSLSKRCPLIQVGSKSDPPIDGALDLRGKTTIRETAALIASSRLFVGLVGFLMHLARAVECPAVIIYGGRELPWQSGYSCNVNLAGKTECSPCWRWNTCDYDRECMALISVDDVVQAINVQVARDSERLATDTVLI